MSNRKKITKITCLILAASMFTSQSVFSDNTVNVTTSSADNTKTVVSSEAVKVEEEKKENTAVSENTADTTDKSNTKSVSSLSSASASEKSDADVTVSKKNNNDKQNENENSSSKIDNIQLKDFYASNNGETLYEDVKCNNATINCLFGLNGFDLEVNGDLILEYDSSIKMQGGKLSVKGDVYITNDGCLDVSGGSLTVLGNVYMSSSSKFIIGDGLAEVSGDVVMESKQTADDKTEYYSTDPIQSVYSRIQMEDKKGILRINGSLNENSSRISLYKAGTLELKGDYNVYYNGGQNDFEKDFKMILSGDTKQRLFSNNKKIVIPNLVINNTSKEGVEVENIVIENFVKHTDAPVTPEYLNSDKAIILEKDCEWNNEEMSGHLIDLNGFTLTAKDDLVLKNTCINVNNGTLIAKGNLDTSENGILIMNNKEGIVSVDKTFIVNLDKNRNNLNAGTVLSRGNVTFKENNTNYFYSGSDFTMIFEGTEKQKISLDCECQNESTPSISIGNFRNENEKGLSIGNDFSFIVSNTLLNSKNKNAFFSDGFIEIYSSIIAESNYFKGNIKFGSEINSDFVVDGNVFGLQSLHGHTLKVNGSMFIDNNCDLRSGNLYVKDDLVVSNGCLKPDTGKIEIGNDLILKNYIQNSDGSISYFGTYSEGENTIVSNGSVSVDNSEGSITVGGSFISNSEAESVIKDGTFEIKGNIEIEDSGFKSFDSSGNGKVVLSGSKKQTVSVEAPGSQFGVLELNNTSADGVEFLTAIQSGSIEKNSTVLKYSDNLKNSKLYENTETVEGDLVLDYRELDLKGKKLTVKGNLIQNGGTIKLNGGSLVCEKDYVLGTGAKLIMNSQDETVDVAGKFVLSSGISHENLLTAGTMFLSGDMEQKNEAAFKTGDKFTFVFDGASPQNIKTNSSSSFGSIKFENTSEKGIHLLSDFYVTGSIYASKCSYSGGAIVLAGNAELNGSNYNGSISIMTPVTLKNDLQISGDLNVLSNLYISEHSVNVNGNINVVRGENNKFVGDIALTTGTLYSGKDLSLDDGKLNVCSGTVKITGDITNKGNIVMDYSDGMIAAGGSFNVLSNTVLKCGIIEIGGNVNLDEGNLKCSESTLVLNGTSKQTFSAKETEYPLVHILEMKNNSKDGVELLSYINADQIIENDTAVKYADGFSIGFTLSEDKEYDELLITGGVLDLNGKILHVKGDFKQHNGKIIFNGGKLIVDGNFDLLNRTEMIMEGAESCLEVKGNANIPQFSNNDRDDSRLSLKEGTFDFSGNLICGKVHAGENFTIKFSGTDAQNISAVDITTGNLMISNSSADGVTVSNRIDVTNKLYDTTSVIKNNWIYLNKGAVLENNYFFGNLHVTELYDDIVINGDLGIDSGFKFNGHKIKVNGDVYIGSDVLVESADQLEVSGDIIVEGGTLKITDKYNINNLVLSSGRIIAEADVNVLGDFIGTRRFLDENGNNMFDVKGYNYNSNYNSNKLEIINSKFTVNGDFDANSDKVSIDVNNSELVINGDINIFKSVNNYTSNNMFDFDENSKMILGGSKKQYVTVKSLNTSLGEIELKNTSAEGVEFLTPVGFEKLISNDVPYTCSDGKEFGFKLEEDMKIKSTKICGGTLDLNGHSLTVEGDLDLSGGILRLNGGELHVTGNLNITGDDGDLSYALVMMKNDADLIDVRGNFNASPASNVFYGNMEHGTVKVGGNLYFRESVEYYYATISAVFEFDGKDKQIIDSNVENVYFSRVKINNSSEDGVEIASEIKVSYLYDTSSKVINSKNILVLVGFPDYAFHGDVTVSGCSHKENNDLNIFGDLYIADYKNSNISKGNVIVTGNLFFNDHISLSEGGGLIVGSSVCGGERSEISLASENSIVYSGGDMSFSTLSQKAGTIRSKGNVHIDRLYNATATSDRIIVLDGENKQKIELPEEIRFDIAMLSKDPETGYEFSVKEPWEKLVKLDHKIESEVPLAPEKLVLSDTKVHAVSLSWNSVQSGNENNNIGYNVYRDGELIGKTYENKFTDSSDKLIPNTSYKYSVEAFNIYRNVSANKAEATFSTAADTQAPSVPVKLKAYKENNTTVHLSWDKSSDNDEVEKYKIYRDGELIEDGRKYNGTTDNSTVIGKIVKYEVSAVDRSGNESEKASVEVDNIVPEAPVDINVSYSKGNISVSWKAPDSKERYYYKIVRSCEGEEDTILNYKYSGTEFSDSSFVLGTKYTYSIYSIDSFENISEEPAKTDAVYSKDDYQPSISFVAATGKINNTEPLKFSASDNIGLKSYKVEISVAGNNEWRILKEGDISGIRNDVSFIPDVSSLKTGTYDVKITVSDEAGNISPEQLVKREYTQTALKTPELDVKLTGNNVCLSWNDQGEENVSNISVYKKSSNETEYKKLNTVYNSTSYTDSSIETDEEDTYYISVVDKFGNAVDSEEKNIKITEEEKFKEYPYCFAEIGNEIEITEADVSVKGSIVIPSEINGKKVTYITENCFENCMAESIVLPNTLKAIGSNAFKNCINIKKFEFPDNNNLLIGDTVFSGCSSLEEVNIKGLINYYSISLPSAKVTVRFNLESSVVNTVMNTNKCIPNDCEYILNDDNTVTIMSYSGNASRINIPDKIDGYPVSEIYDRTFMDKANLSEISIGSNVKKIGSYAFYNCTKLSRVSNYSTLLNQIGADAFTGTSFLNSLHNENNDFACIFTSGEKILLKYFGKSKNVTLPKDITVIADDAFADCDFIKTIKLPYGLKTIGSGAFFGCEKLKKIIIPGNTGYIGDYAFSCCYELSGVSYNRDTCILGKDVFFECKKLSNSYHITENTVTTAATTKAPTVTTTAAKATTAATTKAPAVTTTAAKATTAATTKAPAVTTTAAKATTAATTKAPAVTTTAAKATTAVTTKAPAVTTTAAKATSAVTTKAPAVTTTTAKTTTAVTTKATAVTTAKTTTAASSSSVK